MGLAEAEERYVNIWTVYGCYLKWRKTVASGSGRDTVPLDLQTYIGCSVISGKVSTLSPLCHPSKRTAVTMLSQMKELVSWHGLKQKGTVG